MSRSDDDVGSVPEGRRSAPDPTLRRERRTAWFAVAGLLVLLVGLYGAAVAVAGDRIPTGTRVAGVAISGLTPAEATSALTRDLLPLADEPIAVSAAGEVRMLKPDTLGLHLDVDATVARAGGGTKLDPRTLWTAFFGGDRVDPVVRVEQAKLITALRSLARSSGQQGVQPAITFRGRQPELRKPRAGRQVDVGQAAVAVLDSWLVSDGVVELPVVDTPVAVSAPRLRAAMARAERIVAEPITLDIAAREVRLPPRQFAPALSLQAQGDRLRPRVDTQLLTRRLGAVVSAASREPRDAAFTFVDGRPRLVPARFGARLEAGALADAVLAAATSTDERTARVALDTQRPQLTTGDARRLGIKQLVSSFTTYYPHEDYRNTNIGRAAELIDGTVLHPDQTFSLNHTVGERTAANGFVEGFIISDGIFAEDFGGGVSQVATTVFNAMFFAGLEDVEHKPHSFYIDRYPVGREATVAWGSVDLRFRNDTPYGIYIRSFIESSVPGGTGAMHVEMWSTKVWDIVARQSERYDTVAPETRRISDDECVPTTGYAGFEIDVYRDFFRPDSNEKVRTETFHTDYIPADTVICL